MWNTSSSASPSGGTQKSLTSNVNIEIMCDFLLQNIRKKN